MFDKNKLKGKGLFVFSDPGGAKPLLALVTLIKKNLNDFRIISDRKYDFYDEFSLDVHVPNILSDFDNFKPDFVFTGTSYTSKLELKYIEKSKNKKVVSYSFVDHYSNISLRFLSDGKMFISDFVLLLDDNAKKIAINEGLKKKKIKIFINPYHEYLKQWKPKLSKETFFSKYEIKSKNIITFALDPLSNAGGKKKFGNDEINILKTSLKALEKLKLKEITIVIKPHPNQDISLIMPIISKSKKEILLIKNIDTKLLIYYSDLIIGIFSNFLVEASVLKKNIIRVIEDLKEDPLSNNDIGIVCKNSFELDKALNDYLT